MVNHDKGIEALDQCTSYSDVLRIDTFARKVTVKNFLGFLVNWGLLQKKKVAPWRANSFLLKQSPCPVGELEGIERVLKLPS